MAKLYTTELCQKVAYDCMQIFGGFGYTVEYPDWPTLARCAAAHDRCGDFGDHEGDPREG